MQGWGEEEQGFPEKEEGHVGELGGRVVERKMKRKKKGVAERGAMEALRKKGEKEQGEGREQEKRVGGSRIEKGTKKGGSNASRVERESPRGSLLLVGN